MLRLNIPKQHFDMSDEALAPATLFSRCKFSRETRIANTAHALGLSIVPASIAFNTALCDDAIVIAGGPSVNEQIETIKALNAPVFSIDRMCEWANENNIMIRYVVAIDSSDDVAGFLKHGSLLAQYFLATQCDKTVFDMTALQVRRIFSIIEDDLRAEELETYWSKAGYSAPCLISAGPSVTHFAVLLALLCGYKNIHLFGFDCHVGSGLYAGYDEQSKDIIDVKVGDRVFKTTIPFIMFAERMLALVDSASKTGLLKSIQIYGDSLAGHLFKTQIDWRNGSGQSAYQE